jgi:pimeloyl-ACP methyl ester carboxylesterase
MKDRRRWTFTAVASLVVPIILAAPAVRQGRALSLRGSSSVANPAIPNMIVIGFVGGFVSPRDTRHPEVQFAAYLRDRYPTIHAEVFGNHHGGKALHRLVDLLDTDHDGILSPSEKQRATIILYGHSWGATETVAFARVLGQMGIPVALTIQIDTIAKPGRPASAIPPNVATAINFFQPVGPLHGQTQIVAADSSRTRILGNLRMTYEDRPIDCDNYSWYSRTLNRSHHEIENDFRVWDEVASLIDSSLPHAPSILHPPTPYDSPFFRYLRRGFQSHLTDTTLIAIPAASAAKFSPAAAQSQTLPPTGLPPNPPPSY